MCNGAKKTSPPQISGSSVVSQAGMLPPKEESFQGSEGLPTVHPGE